MAASCPSDIRELLQKLSFDKWYPGKLSVSDLNEITELSLSEGKVDQKDTGWHFINRLTRLNYNARYIKHDNQSSNKSTGVSFLQRKRQFAEDRSKVCHPLDIVVTIFLCCDPVAKQDLVKCLWNCKLAIPFVVQPDKSKSPDIFTWPLRNVIGQWQGKDDTASNEYPLLNYPMEKVCFMRVGDLNESKSALLNRIVGGVEKEHPVFFHRDLSGSTKQRSSVVEGLIELSWYLPKGTETDTFSSCMMFANLRGNASVHKEQTQLLLEIMDTLVIFGNTKDLLPNLELLQTAITGPKKTLIVITDLTIGENEGDIIDEFISKVGRDDDAEYIITLEDIRVAEKVELLKSHLSTACTNSFKSLRAALEDISPVCGNIDETYDASLIDGLRMAKEITSEIERADPVNRKSILLQVQGEKWKRWTQAEKEIHRLESFRNSTDIEHDISSYRNSLEETKLQLRKEQLDHLNRLPVFIKQFIRCLRDFDGSKLKIFLRMIKLGLGEITRTLLRSYYSKYMELLAKNVVASEDKRQELQDQLDKLDKEKAEFSIGLEHIVREIGQIFEASFDSDNHDDLMIHLTTSSDSVACKDLPYLVSKILIHGYPLELMDGDVGYIPEAWVQHVIASLRQHLNQSDPKSREPRIHVVSVLGIQSSGKSTFLNTTFGLQFSVSAGCCTKGVFMQVLKVESCLSKTYGYDYVIAIDTEGLRSAKLSTQFDNELSCFAMGLTDYTVINLMGENVTYLQENLPIVVHAILRMNMSGLKPRCIIVHHNVDKRDKEKLMEQGRLLEKVLNELTAKACDIDGEPRKQFTDIVEFDINTDTDYVPAYLEGEQPMGVSPGYSKECDNIRRKLLLRSATNSRKLTLKEFAIHLQSLWDAIKTNHFVFEFKSTRETLTRLHLDEQFSKILRGLLEALSHLSKAEKGIILRCTNKDELEKTLSDLLIRVRETIASVDKQKRTELLTYIEGPGESVLHHVGQWKQEIIDKFNIELQKATEDCIDGLQGLYEQQLFKFQQSLPNFGQANDIARLNDIARQTRRQNRHIKDVDILAEGMWITLEQEKEDIHASQHNLTEKRVTGDVEKILLDICSAEKHILDKTLKNKSMKDWSLKSIRVKDEVITKRASLLCTKDQKIKDEVEQAVQDLSSYLQNELDLICTSENPYSNTQIKRIFLGAKHIINSQKNKITREFMVDLYLSVGGSIVQELPHKQQEESRRSEEYMVKRQKKYMKPLLKSLLEEGTRVSLIVSGISTMVIEEVIKKTITNLDEKSHRLSTYYPLSKMQLIKRLLRESINSKDYQAFELYRTDPKAAVEYMLARSVKNEKLTREAISEFKKLTNSFMRIFRISDNAKDISFVSHLKTSLCAIEIEMTKESENIIQVFKGDAHAVIGDVSKRVDKFCEIDAEKVLASEISEKESDIKQRHVGTFMKSRFGCWEKCPFCNEICMFEISNHVGPHQASMHRPIACSGASFGRNGSSLESCSHWIASDAMFEFGGKQIPFKRYREVFKDWKIQGNASLQTSYIWKWFFYYHRNLLPRHWTIRAPSSWRIITENKVLHYLRSDTYSVNWSDV